MRLASLGALIVPIDTRPTLESDIWAMIEIYEDEASSAADAAEQREDELKRAGRFLLGAIAAGAAAFIVVSQLLGSATSAQSSGPEQASAVQQSNGDSDD